VVHLYMWFQQVAKNYRSLTFFFLPYLVYNQILLNLPRMHHLHFGCITKLTKKHHWQLSSPCHLFCLAGYGVTVDGWYLLCWVSTDWSAVLLFSWCYKGPIWLAFHKKNYWNKWRCPNTIAEWRTLIVFPPERISGRPAFFCIPVLFAWLDK
jgi:hypothetical protein